MYQAAARFERGRRWPHAASKGRPGRQPSLAGHLQLALHRLQAGRACRGQAASADSVLAVLATARPSHLCKRARLILAELTDAEQELGLWHSGGAGHVVIGALPVAAPMLIPQALKALAVLTPRVTVEVIEGAYDRSGSANLNR